MSAVELTFVMNDFQRMPKGIIYKSIGVKINNAPFIASFSARGPQLISLNILKVFNDLSAYYLFETFDNVGTKLQQIYIHTFNDIYFSNYFTY